MKQRPLREVDASIPRGAHSPIGGESVSSQGSRLAAPARRRGEPGQRPPEMYFAARRERVGDTVRVVVEGEVDLATAPRLADELARAAAEATVVVADLTCVTLFDSTALLVLLKATLALRARGGDLAVRPPDGPARRLFGLAGVDRPLTLPKRDGHARRNGAPADERLRSLASALLDENAHLQRALTSRIVIEQAKGMLAERLELDVDAAFGLLRRTARNRRQRLHDLASAVVEGSEEAEKLFARSS